METKKTIGTLVLNLLDGREAFFQLPPDEAVVAAFETFENGVHFSELLVNPPAHPNFSEYRLGYSCGDWIAYKENRV